MALLFPSGIFLDRSLSPLETIVLYLKEKKGLSYAKIAEALNRDSRTIWTSYSRATKKLISECRSLDWLPYGVEIPVQVIRNRNLSILEAIVSHLKKEGFSYAAIARILNRDQRTIWTVNRRMEEKNAK